MTTGYGRGYCHQLLLDGSGNLIPNYSVTANLSDILGAVAPINGVKSGAYQSMLLEYVDTSSVSETPESYFGVIP